MMGFKQIRDKSLINLLNKKDVIVTSSSDGKYTASQLSDNDVKSFWAAKKDDHNPTINIDLYTSLSMNALLIQEPIALGQRIIQFSVDLIDENGKMETILAHTIGNKRILTFKERKIKNIQVKFLDAKGQILISNVELLKITSAQNESLFQ
jgi:alpha-L-fucosidase